MDKMQGLVVVPADGLKGENFVGIESAFCEGKCLIVLMRQ